MKTFLLILGVVMLLLGIQDAVRLLVENVQSSIFSFIPGGTSLHIGLDVVLAIGGALIAGSASKKDKSKP